MEFFFSRIQKITDYAYKNYNRHYQKSKFTPLGVKIPTLDSKVGAIDHSTECCGMGLHGCRRGRIWHHDLARRHRS
jgi:hypothetical protein